MKILTILFIALTPLFFAHSYEGDQKNQNSEFLENPSHHTPITPNRITYKKIGQIEGKFPELFFMVPACANLKDSDLVVVRLASHTYAVSIPYNLNDYGICADQSKKEYSILLHLVDDRIGNIVVNDMIFPYDFYMEEIKPHN